MLLKITLPSGHVNMSPVEYGTFASRCMKKFNMDDREGQASAGTPSKRRKIPSSETLPIAVATKIAHKYRRKHHTRSPLSGTGHRLLLKYVGEPSSSSVDESSHFKRAIELARGEYLELNVKYNLEE